MKRLAFVSLLLLAGCGQEGSKVDRSTAKGLIDQLTYFKDSRSGVCFAVVASRGDFEVKQNGFTITYVPCTPAVEALIR